jgi:hypothetical protein
MACRVWMVLLLSLSVVLLLGCGSDHDQVVAGEIIAEAEWYEVPDPWWRDCPDGDHGRVISDYGAGTTGEPSPEAAILRYLEGLHVGSALDAALTAAASGQPAMTANGPAELVVPEGDGDAVLVVDDRVSALVHFEEFGGGYVVGSVSDCSSDYPPTEAELAEATAAVDG